MNIKVKENLFAIAEIIGKENLKKCNLLSTASDILRYAYFVSKEDWKMMPKGTKFKLKTSDKNVIMNSLNKLARKDINNTFGDMKPYKSQWLSVSKNLFPSSKKFNRYSDAQELFNILRNNKKVETFNSTTQKLISEKNYIELAGHLSHKPGELLRNLDMIIRNINKGSFDTLVNIIKDIKLNPKLILQVKKWIEYRKDNELSERIFNIKGKMKTIDNKQIYFLKLR